MNRIRLIEYNREYYRQHKDSIMRVKKIWRDKNKDKRRGYNHNFRQKHLYRIRIHEGYYREAMLLYALDVFGHHACVRCGFKDKRALQFDDINAFGNSGRKKRRVGLVLQCWIVNNPEKAKKKYQVLCANCNWMKRWENNEVPNKHAIKYG